MSLQSILAALLLTAPAFAGGLNEPVAPTGTAIKAAKVLALPYEGQQVIDHGVVIIRGGKIEAVGPSSTTPIPAGYDVIDVGENWLAPGMVDLHAHIAGMPFGAVNDLNDMVYLTNPGLRASSAVVPENGALKRGVASGVTSILYIPGSGTNVGGQGVLLKTFRERYEQMEIRNPGSLKLAQAGNPERWVMGVRRAFMNWNTRNTFRRGVAYAKRWADYQEKGGEKPDVDLQFEVFRDLYEGRTQVSTHTQIYQVVSMTVRMIRRELGLPVYIDHGTFDGWKAAAQAEDAGVPAILGPRVISRTYPGFLDTDGQIQGVAAKYQEMGHTMIGFNTDAPVIPEEELFLQSSMGVRYGFESTNLEHLRGLTIIPAKTAGIDGRVGSIEVGKDADILVVTGDPADPRSYVETTFIDGERVYDASEERVW